MLRKLICASVVLTFSVGLVVAGEIRAVITNVDKSQKVSFYEYKAKKEKGPETTLPADKVKVFFGKFNWDTQTAERDGLVPHGLKNRLFENKNLSALIVTDRENKKITEIRVFKPR